jgi:cysteinyl-tRNA synthetase
VTARTCEPSAAFLEALDDDLNTPRANAELFALAKRLETASGAERARAKGELLASGGLIGFLQADPEAWFQGAADPALKTRVEGLLARRAAARAAKDFAEADAIRDQLTAMDVEVMDGASGASWRLRERA